MRTEFGTTSDGRTAGLYTIENEHIRLSATDYGATLVSLEVRSCGRDVLLGHTDVKAYEKLDSCMGAVIGRVCNRIAGGRFVLHDREYHLDINNGPNCLHSGFSGYQDRFFAVTEKTDERRRDLILKGFSVCRDFSVFSPKPAKNDERAGRPSAGGKTVRALACGRLPCYDFPEDRYGPGRSFIWISAIIPGWRRCARAFRRPFRKIHRRSG